MTKTTNAPQDRLGPRGRRFWDHATDTYELSASELEMLLEACRTLDSLDALAAAVAQDGTTIPGSTGQTIVHPALGEARGQRALLHKLLAALALPDEEGGEDTGALLTPRQVSARAAAAARWAGVDTEAGRRRRGAASS